MLDEQLRRAFRRQFLTTATNWTAAIQALREANALLRKAVGQFNPNNLDQPLIPSQPYTAYTQFIGITQHDLYHAGQIAILRKMAQSKS